MLVWRESEDQLAYELVYVIQGNEIPVGGVALNPESKCLTGHVHNNPQSVCFKGESDRAYNRALKKLMKQLTELGEAYVRRCISG